jgi:hypothetical protein
MYRTLILITISLVTCGCTSLFDTWSRDPVRVVKIKASKDDTVAAISLSAEKRNVVVSLRGDNSGRYCAEPPPEVAKTFDIDRSKLFEGEGQLTAEEKAKLKAELKEKVKEAATVLGERTVLLDIYRTGVYSLCQFYINGAIKNGDDVLREFTRLTDAVLAAYEQSVTTKKDDTETEVGRPSNQE